MKEFEGNLKSINPSKIIQKDKDSDFDNFFLVLGLIFNDLKDLLFFVEYIVKEYRKPNSDNSEPPNDHLGSWAGLNNHLNRLIISLTSELFIFLEKNKKVTSSISFILFEKKLPSDIRNDWHDVLDVLYDENKNDFLSHISRIRSNVTFHYDQSLKEIRSGFINTFFDSPKNNYNQKAYYSLGDNVSTTRFYYCDGAVSSYTDKLLKIKSENYLNDIVKIVGKINNTIRFMMESYLEDKK